jgi:hypothetical protein
MKLSISLEVADQEEANEVLAALIKIANLPYRLSVFGAGHPVDPAKAVVTQTIDPKYVKHPPKPVESHYSPHAGMVDKLGENADEQENDDTTQTSPHALPIKPSSAFSLVEDDDEMPTPPPHRDNVEPSGNVATKLFASTRAKIIEGLSAIPPHQPHKDYAEAAKLLWTRGEVGFDGRLYYL